MFSYKICKIFKNTYIEGYLQTTASRYYKVEQSIITKPVIFALIQSEQKLFRSSHQGMFYKKGGLINLGKFSGKQLLESLFFNKVGG